MTGNSLESLLAWMQGDSRMHEWDVLVALSASRVNQGLEQEQAHRLARQGIWQVPALQVPIPDSPYTHFFEGLQLGAPQLTLAHASLERSDTPLRLPLFGGTDMLVYQKPGEKYISRLSAWSPQTAPALEMEVRLVGSTDAQGRLALQLDPAQADEIDLNLEGSALVRAEIGRQLLAWFKAQPPLQRTWPVVALGETDNPMMHGASLVARTQLDPAARAVAHVSSDNAWGAAATPVPSGALILFVSMEHGQPGGFPGDNSGFRYLLPDDEGQTYNATALFSTHLQHRAALAAGVQGLFTGANFTYQPASGKVQTMRATAGSLQVPATRLRSEDFEFECDAFAIQAASGGQPLAAAFEDTGARQTWQGRCEVPLRYRLISGGDWQTHTARFDVNVEFEFHLAAEPAARQGMEGHLFVPYGLSEEARLVDGLPTLPADQLAQLQGLVAIAVKRALLERYSQSLRIDASQAWLASSAFSGVLGFEPVVQALPYDQAQFGRLADGRGPWYIEPQHALVAVGQTLQLSVTPAREGLRWSVQNPPDSGGDPGSIDDTGLYQAPAAHALGAPARQVLVVASDPDSGERAFVAVMVASRSISVDPLIEACSAGDELTLTASLAGTGALQWSIGNPVSGESGTLLPDAQGRVCTYRAATTIRDKRYVIDQVQVSDPASGNSESLWILARHAPSSGQIRVDPLEEGRVQLRHLIGADEFDSQWRLEAGSPGSVDEQGVYQADPGSSQPFALVFARAQVLTLVFEHYIILPLPLSQYPVVMQALAQP